MAGEEIKELLADFRNKRALGLGSLFGDHQLEGNIMCIIFFASIYVQIPNIACRSGELMILINLLLPFLNHWLSLQSDWLSAVRFFPKSLYFLL